MSPELKSALFAFFKENGVIVGLFVLGVVFVGWGIFLFFYGDREEVEFLSDSQVEIAIDVSGAVINPGVYYLESGDRIHDALIAAGGLSGDADREYISQYVNLVRVLEDGEKVYIPYYGEVVSDMTITAELVGNIEFISINSASVAELEELPGVGEVTAGKIIEGRPYSRIEELREKGVVGEKLFSDIESLISL